MLKAVVFDLDDTLITSSLNLNLIRSELGIPEKTPILEYIETLPTERKEKASALVLEHELDASSTAIINPGVCELFEFLRLKKIRIGLFTRNCLPVAQNVSKNLNLIFDCIITRDCAPAKPSPEGLVRMVKKWNTKDDELIYVGDFLYDIEVGLKAGVTTALYAPKETPVYSQKADIVFKDFFEFKKLICLRYKNLDYL